VSLVSRILLVVRAVILGILIAMVGQGVWSAILVVNLKTTPSIPWSVALMIVLLWLIWQYLGGRWWPRSNSEARRRNLRANSVSGEVFGWAILSGALSLVALSAYWIVMSQIVRVPSSVLPDMSMYPRLTVAMMVVTGSLVSPILEQAGIWGYCQSMLERAFSGPLAVLLTSIVFAILPHPPMHSPLWPKLIFYFLTGAMLGVTAYLTKSILPGLIVHVVGLLTFFVLVFPHDTTRRLVSEGGADGLFWLHVAQAIVFTVLAALGFVHLASVTARDGVS
jgi:membrane protease YdiL (CAAX protease family)